MPIDNAYLEKEKLIVDDFYKDIREIAESLGYKSKFQEYLEEFEGEDAHENSAK